MLEVDDLEEARKAASNYKLYLKGLPSNVIKVSGIRMESIMKSLLSFEISFHMGASRSLKPGSSTLPTRDHHHYALSSLCYERKDSAVVLFRDNGWHFTPC